MKWNVRIISHTHWDREWYLNSPYTNEWLIPFFDSLFTMLEKEPEYQFVLDGQLSMIDDYFDELRKKNIAVYQYKNLIRKYAKEGRLFVGPYYLQPDWQLVSDESLVRNIVIGSKMAQELGKCMNVGWMLDNFGQISQTAQLHKEAGLEGIFVWRGVEMDPHNVKSEFIWEAPDGTQLPCVYLLNSYRNVMRLAEFSDIMKKRVDSEVEKLKPFMVSSNILMMNGYDQEIVPDDIQPYIRSGILNDEEKVVTQSNPEEYLQCVLAENPSLPTLHGALYSGRFISVFPGVMSARMYLKQQNDIAQKTIEKFAEPIATLDFLLGKGYDQTFFTNAWKVLLKNHPHDSICGVSIDDVHSDMERRTDLFHQMLTPQIESHIQSIADSIDTSSLSDANYFVYNPSFYKRKSIVEIEGKTRFVETEGMGYTYVNTDETVEKKVFIDDMKIYNSLIEITINENGSFDLLDKETNKSHTGLGVIEDSGDAGDEYNYSYPTKDTYFHSTDFKILELEKRETDLIAEITLTYEMNLPKELSKDRSSRSTEMLSLPIKTTYTVEAESKAVKIKTTLLNTVKDHIMRVLFPSDIQAEHTFAGSPFDVVQRPIKIADYDENDIPENVRKVIVGAREAKPNTIFLCKDFVDISDSKQGLSVFSKGLPEYTVYPERNTIALTLFRAVNWIATEINTRIGDAGPLIYTPEAECLREMTFEYAVYPHAGNYEAGEVVRKADSFNTDLLTFVTDKHSGTLPLSKAFFEVIDPSNNIKVTACKKAEDSNAVLIRMYNASQEATKVTLKSSQSLIKAQICNFLEEVKNSIPVQNNTVCFDIKAKQIVTLLLTVNIEANTTTHQKSITDIFELPTKRNLFVGYKTAELVTKEDVTSEEKRSESLKDRINEDLWRRTALEARLSAILTQRRLDETIIRDLGLKLNEARVKRRIYDYVKDVEKNT